MRTPTHSTLLLALALGCGEPPVDDFRSEGGTAPDPTGVIEGSVLYQGPRPRCDRDEGGAPTRIRGRVILTLFAYDDPPPPEGTATSAANLLALPGDLLFTDLGDCMPPEGSSEFLTRTTDFLWPEIPLGASYQIRGFYDYDEDFNPFFGVTNLPTAGDVAGGALQNPSDPSAGFRPIAFGTAAEFPDGQVYGGVSVALGAPVNTERPIFTLAATPMSSEATLPDTGDPVEDERLVWEIASASLSLYPRDPDDARTAALLEALHEGGLDVDPTNPIAYAWYVRPVDANGDGVPDAHPILGRSAGIQWSYPITVMQRARSEVEVAARVPAVSLIPSVRPLATAVKKVFYPTIEIAIPPVAVMQTAADARCQFPIIPPGNTAEYLEGGGVVDVECAELPTGYYGTNVLHGVAAARPVGGGVTACDPSGDIEAQCGAGVGCIDEVCAIPGLVSETGWNLSGGQYSSQAWTIPNDLADPEQIPLDGVDEEAGRRFRAEQGNESLYVVYDASPFDADHPDDVMGRQSGRAECLRAPETGATDAPIVEVEYTDFSEYGDQADEVREICCAPVRHLCALPLCPTIPADPSMPDGARIYAPPTSLGEDGITPSCVAFEMPAFCCE